MDVSSNLLFESTDDSDEQTIRASDLDTIGAAMDDDDAEPCRWDLCDSHYHLNDDHDPQDSTEDDFDSLNEMEKNWLFWKACLAF